MNWCPICDNKGIIISGSSIIQCEHYRVKDEM